MRDSLRNHEKRSHLNRTEVINNLVLRGADIENYCRLVIQLMRYYNR